ncbi:hypothetical protein PV327_004095 [Microctonus hyperodae]|uniref:Myb/SANT-like DNA-binding domain-containing protein n=1 Tax=Microctonus hyperodae TaxID=165561 RepID=A0AA39KMA9_MICHY|nr:hypothetical protein PV327_004095 [Microctonus hyperodae]
MNNNFENSSIWTDTEVEKVLAIIDTMNLSKDLSLQKFAPSAIQLISNGLLTAGFHKTFEEVETILMSLKMSYLKCKKARLNTSGEYSCPYYDSLDRIWNLSIDLNFCQKTIDNVSEGSKIKNSSVLDEKVISERSRPWSDEETMDLLNLIDKLHLVTNFRYRLSPSAIQKLVKPLNQCGYTRTCNQIMEKMRRMRVGYLRSIRADSTPKDMNNSPFYDKIDKMFQRLLTTNNTSFSQPNDHDYENKVEFSTNVDTQKSNDFFSMWHSIQSLTGNEETFFEPTESASNNKTGQTYIKEFQNNTFKDIDDACLNNTTNIKKSIGENFDLTVNCQASESKQDEHHMLKNHIESTKINKKRKNAKIPESRVPKFIRVVRGKSTFILKKIDTPSYMKFEQPSITRFRSTIEELNINSIRSSHSLMKLSPTPVNRTFSDKFTDCSESIANLAPISLVNTTSQTTSTATDLKIFETIKTVTKQMMNHQELMQKQHHVWMEKQFEIQRNYDRDQRVLLLRELREFRQELRDVTEQLFTG